MIRLVRSFNYNNLEWSISKAISIGEESAQNSWSRLLGRWSPFSIVINISPSLMPVRASVGRDVDRLKCYEGWRRFNYRNAVKMSRTVIPRARGHRSTINFELIRWTTGRGVNLTTPAVTWSWMVLVAHGGVVRCKSRQYWWNHQARWQNFNIHA